MASLSTMEKLAAVLLPVVLLSACEGGGGPSGVEPEHERAQLQHGPALTKEAPLIDAVDEAIVDLGLVDSSQAVRVDVAANGYGFLTAEQFSVALIDEHPAVRQAAIDGVIGAPEQILRERLELLKYAMTDPDESVRESVVAALEGLDDPRSIALLLEAQADSSPLVREEAREALVRLRAPEPSVSEESLQSGD